MCTKNYQTQSETVALTLYLFRIEQIQKLLFFSLQVKKAFDHAFAILTTAVNPFFSNSQTTILGRIIRVTDEVIRYRQWVEEQFSSELSRILTSSLPPPPPPHTTSRTPRSLSSSGSTSSVDSGGSSDVSLKNVNDNQFVTILVKNGQQKPFS